MATIPNVGLPRSILTSPALSILVPVALGSGIGFLVNKGSETKSTYGQTRQPPLAPPSWVFGPVWTVLYASMGYASHLAYKGDPLDTYGQSLYTIQLGLNLLWTPLFFGMGNVPAALVDLLLMEASIVTLVNRWWGRGGEWLIPYACWTGFAGYLTVGVGILNNWTLKPAKGKAKAK